MHSLREVTRTDRIFLVAHCYFWYPSSTGHFNITIDGTSTRGPRHRNQGLNVVFVDGHGEFVKNLGWNSANRPYQGSRGWPIEDASGNVVGNRKNFGDMWSNQDFTGNWNPDPPRSTHLIHRGITPVAY